MTAMSTVPWLTILGLIPLVGALVVAFVPGNAETAKRLALGFSLVTLVVGIIAALQFDRGSSKQFQLGEQYSWIPQFGVSYALGVDGAAGGLAALVGGTSSRLRRLQNGFARSYALTMLAGVVAILGALWVMS